MAVKNFIYEILNYNAEVLITVNSHVKIYVNIAYFCYVRVLNLFIIPTNGTLLFKLNY